MEGGDQTIGAQFWTQYVLWCKQNGVAAHFDSYGQWLDEQGLEETPDWLYREAALDNAERLLNE